MVGKEDDVWKEWIGEGEKHSQSVNAHGETQRQTHLQRKVNQSPSPSPKETGRQRSPRIVKETLEKKLYPYACTGLS